ncbi:hypothetical protein SynMITS9220_01803 [Synechococcus sp. MIT S9220]|nr:hypothetical protein SynMITS9220_01803 [Synechococcus sp. MIT S9220]
MVNPLEARWKRIGFAMAICSVRLAGAEFHPWTNNCQSKDLQPNIVY